MKRLTKRNVQPGVPSIGATCDVIGFFWNMAIVALSAILIILCFILRWKPETKEKVVSCSRKLRHRSSSVFPLD